MPQTIMIELPDDVCQALAEWAQEENQPLEAVAAEYLTSLVRRMAKDALLKWAGAFSSEVPNVGDRHDQFIGQAIHGDRRDVPNA